MIAHALTSTERISTELAVRANDLAKKAQIAKS
jgi:hypothetical protein